MILGDSLLVMTSLAEKEALKGQVQCIYMDPPYGIRFNSNWQPSTKSCDVKDGQMDSVSREPEMIRAFRDTWKDGIHSYLSYLRDRLVAARELLHESGSIFVQIGDENAHLLRSVLDEVFGANNSISQIAISKTAGATSIFLPAVIDYTLWYAKDRGKLKYRDLYIVKSLGSEGSAKYNRLWLPDFSSRSLEPEEIRGKMLPARARIYRQDNLTSQSVGREKGEGAASWFPVGIRGQEIRPNERVR
jgi:adenine-specific DNA-methyltransferase